MAQLALFSLSPPRPWPIRLNLHRWRGTVEPPLSFAIVREEDRLTWLGFPVQQACTAQVVFERFREQHRDLGLTNDLEFVAGGSMAEAAIDFTESRVERDDIYGMVAGVFGSPQEPYYHLSRYENAVVTTAFDANGGLTVVQILALYGLEPYRVD